MLTQTSCGGGVKSFRLTVLVISSFFMNGTKVNVNERPQQQYVATCEIVYLIRVLKVSAQRLGSICVHLLYLTASPHPL